MGKLEAMLDDLLARGGHALHLSGGHPPLLRRGGALEPLGDEVLDPDELRKILMATMDSKQRARLGRDRYVDFTHAHRGSIRLAARCLHDAGGLSAILRLLPNRAPSLEDIGCPEPIKRAYERGSGLVLCVGPRGSGKTVTIAALLDHSNHTRACRILTVEQPVEIQHRAGRAQILHREVGVDAPSFASAIRSAGQEDVDVVMVSDLSERSAITAALEIASAGVLVVAGVLGRGATRALDLLIRAFPPEDRPRVRAQLADSLAAVVSLELLDAEAFGVVTAHEVLLGSPALSAMIREDRIAEIPSLMEAGGAVGMQTMETSLERLVTRGLVRAEVALDHALDRESLQRLLGRRPSSVPPS